VTVTGLAVCDECVRRRDKYRPVRLERGVRVWVCRQCWRAHGYDGDGPALKESTGDDWHPGFMWPRGVSPE
jgi:hypothetical protein